MEHRALGKGLSALIPDKADMPEEVIKHESVAFVPTEKIRDNALQPRENYDQSKINELMSSIKEQGLLQPLLVRQTQDGFFEVIAGERRLKAARAIALEEVPVVIKRASNQESLTLALIENIQREELNAIEEGKAFKRLIDDFGLSQDDVATAVGKDRSTISNTMRLLKLPEEIQKGVVGGKISMGHARALLSIEDANKQRLLYEEILVKGLSVREVENLTRAKIQAAAPATVKKTAAKPKDQDLVRLEESLQQRLGTKVRIQAKKKRGKIIVEYYSLDDLERILRLMGNTFSQ